MLYAIAGQGTNIDRTKRLVSKIEHARGGQKLTDKDVLLVLGDVMSSIKKADGQKEYDWSVIEWFAKQPYTVCFIDGNHDDIDAIRKRGKQTKRYGNICLRVAPGVLFLEPGYVYSIPISRYDYRNVLAIGGAEDPILGLPHIMRHRGASKIKDTKEIIEQLVHEKAQDEQDAAESAKEQTFLDNLQGLDETEVVQIDNSEQNTTLVISPIIDDDNTPDPVKEALIKHLDEAGEVTKDTGTDDEGIIILGAEEVSQREIDAFFNVDGTDDGNGNSSTSILDMPEDKPEKKGFFRRFFKRNKNKEEDISEVNSSNLGTIETVEISEKENGELLEERYTKFFPNGQMTPRHSNIGGEIDYERKPHIDYVISHDVPASHRGILSAAVRETNMMRVLDDIASGIEFDRWIFGGYKIDMETDPGFVSINSRPMELK